jgi:hypothetical protein
LLDFVGFCWLLLPTLACWEDWLVALDLNLAAGKSELARLFEIIASAKAKGGASLQ